MLVPLLALSWVSSLLAVPAPEDLNIHIHLEPQETGEGETEIEQGEALTV